MATSATAYDLVKRLCPLWLNGRRPRSPHLQAELTVYVDGIHVGGREALGRIPASHVEEIRRLRATDVTLPWGHGAGALFVTTRMR